MFIGPVFARELVTTPRRPQHYLTRSVYVTALLVLMCTAWLVVAGTQIIRNVGDMARFGASLFQVLAPLQLALITFLAALGDRAGEVAGAEHPQPRRRLHRLEEDHHLAAACLANGSDLPRGGDDGAQAARLGQPRQTGGILDRRTGEADAEAL